VTLNAEVERIYKQVAVAYFKAISKHFPGLKKMMKPSYRTHYECVCVCMSAWVGCIIIDTARYRTK
jgi:hypothetical protein